MRKSVRRIKERFIETYTQVCGPLKERCEYLDYWNLDTGYMLSFNFNKKKEQGVKRVQIGDKVLLEGTV